MFQREIISRHDDFIFTGKMPKYPAYRTFAVP
jgi:hypothetical protein